MLKAKYLIILYQTQLLVHFVEVVLFGSHDDDVVAVVVVGVSLQSVAIFGIQN